MKKSLLTILCCTVFIVNVFCQQKQKWQVEVGVLKNSIETEIYVSGEDDPRVATFTDSTILPALRISRNIDLPFSLSIQPFMGMATTGYNRSEITKSSLLIDTTYYALNSYFQSKVRHYHLDFGGFITYSINNFDLKVGLRGQQLLYEVIEAADEVNLNNQIELRPNIHNYVGNTTGGFKRFSTHLGFGIQYNLSRFTIGTEGWLGISDMSDAVGDWFTEENIYENNIRLMVGFRF